VGEGSQKNSYGGDETELVVLECEKVRRYLAG